MNYGLWILVAVVAIQSLWLVILTWWLGAVEEYAIDLHNHDINDIRYEIWKMKKGHDA